MLTQAWPRALGHHAFDSSFLSTAAVFFARRISTREGNANRILQELRGGGSFQQLLPFKLTEEQAQAAFNRWHEQHALSPSGLLSAASGPTRQALLPFWLFEATLHVEYTGLLGFPMDGGAVEYRNTHWRHRGNREYSWKQPAMQVYASYRHRRDLVEVLKPCPTQGRVLKRQEALAQESAAGARGEGVPIDPPDMRQSIAWHLAVVAVKKQEAAAAEELLRSETECERVREVQVRLRIRRRNARLVYIPAFTVDYFYGENFNVHGVRRPEQFQAVISGLDGSVAAERHFSPQKVQLTAAVVMGTLSSAAAAVGLQGQMLLSPASFLAALLVCTSAGLAARLSPLLLRQQEEDRRIQTEEADMEKVMSQGLGPQDVLDDKHEEIRSNAEWRRWEEANKWAWDGSKRQKWAEALWRRQQARRLQRREFERRRARAEARFHYEQEAEAQRRRRWGHSSHHARFSQGSHNVFSGSESGGGTKDFLGYYALLGLDGELRGSISSSDIKRAFQEAAMRWHPDRLHVDDDTERTRAHERFAKVKKAYEVLRNPEKRRDYDSGIRDYG